ncbi:MAG: DEAD/DEAH box helicase [Planctomycetaceae bacterium]|jgi:ATP-dependent RNA helicase DeaD|nr:DEAD/DEAH box helicase [Planctomycetaceae bacterium]
MAKEQKSNENKRHNGKKSGRRFGKRRENYVDSFRWGFVEGEDREDVGPDDELYFGEPEDSKILEKPKKTEHSKPQRSKKSANRTLAAKNNETKEPLTKTVKKPDGKNNRTYRNDKMAVQLPISDLPLFDSDNDNDNDDDDLNLPSYGRTPVPKDNELPQVIPSQKIDKKHRDANQPPQPQVQTKSNIVPVIPPASQSVSLRARKEQMVWDPDKREYVPLIIPEKIPDKKQTPPVDRQPVPKNERNSATELPKISNTEKEPISVRKKKKRSRNKLKSTVSVSPQESRHEKKPEIPPAVTENKTDIKTNAGKTATQQQETEKDSFRSKNHQEFREERQQETYRSVSQHRGDIQPLVESKNPDPADIEAEVSGFAELGVSETMLDALKIVRYLEPTPIQSGVFKQVKAGTDLMGQAQTGTGKTAAFCIPIIEGVEECPPGNDPVALILVPTRELAVQVRDEAVRLAYGRDIRMTACYGGKPLAKQIARLRDGIDVIVGTPGRILDLMNRRALSLSHLRWVVLDEADRMLDIGFRPDIEKILKRTPPERQTLLFSATLPQPVVRLAEKYMKSPEVHDFSNKGLAVETIEQFYVTVDPERKFDALVYLLNEQQPNQAIIFTRTKRGADRLARLLAKQVESLAAIHGDLAQGERDRVMTQFRAGKLRYLVATDVVGRGIDVSGISHIINYDIPAFCDDYIHRVGRTGRMGREGVAYTFVTVQEGSELTRIEMRIDKLLKRADLKGFESFTKPSDPNVTPDEESSQEPKPVYGKHVRKIRRAL